MQEENLNGVLDLSKLVFTQDYPQEEGVFLWRSKHTNSLFIINVTYYPERYDYGFMLSSYYGVKEIRGKDVTRLQGTFCRIIQN